MKQAQPVDSYTGPFMGFGVTWLTGMPYEASGQDGQICNTNQIEIGGSPGNCPGDSWDPCPPTAPAACTNLWNDDVGALQALKPAYVRTNIALTWFATCDGDTLKTSFTGPEFANKVTDLKMLQGLKIPVILTISPTPVGDDCLSYPTYSPSTETCPGTVGSGRGWLNAVEALFHQLGSDGIDNVEYFGGVSEPNGKQTVADNNVPLTYEDYACATEALSAWFNGNDPAPVYMPPTYRPPAGGTAAAVEVVGPTVAGPNGTDPSNETGFWACKGNETSECWTSRVAAAEAAGSTSPKVQDDWLNVGAFDWHQYIPDSVSSLTGGSVTIDCSDGAATEGADEMAEMGQSSQSSALTSDESSLYSDGDDDVPTILTEVGLRDFAPVSTEEPGTGATTATTNVSNCNPNIEYGGLGITTDDYAVGMFDYGVQLVDGGIAGALAWDLDGDISNSLVPGAGMVNDEIADNSTRGALEPWFYTWKGLIEAFPAGSTTVPMSTNWEDVVAAEDLPVVQDPLFQSVALADVASGGSPTRAVNLPLPDSATGEMWNLCQFTGSGWTLTGGGGAPAGGGSVPVSMTPGSAVVVQMYPVGSKAASPVC